MKKLFFCLCITFNLIAYSQEAAPHYKSEINGGAVMTALGGAFLAVGPAVTVLGTTAKGPPETHPSPGAGNGYLISGSIFIAAGVALIIAGPIILSRGIHHRKLARQTTTLNFTSSGSLDFDKYIPAKSQNKVCGMTFNF